MRILHTSDWHIGRSLYGRKRYDEFAAFFDWLAKLITEQQIDALLVAGDIFDTSTPSNRSQELYYRFLCRVARSSCRHIIVIAGNHDSPSFLNAPKEILRALDVHVIGAMTAQHADEVLVLKDTHDHPQAIVCAVPYLRDRDIRTVDAGETLEDKSAKLVAGLQAHYAAVCRIAEQCREEIGEVPIIAMGHLFTAGGKTVDDDGVRELYVGALTRVGADAFPTCIDYLALGHLHVAQCVGQRENMRYSGSPIPMGYNEAGHAKKVVLVEFNSRVPAIQEIQVPCFQPLVRISGSLAVIQDRIDELKRQDSNAWLEIEYTGQEIVGDMRELIETSLAGSAMEVRRIKNKRVIDRVLGEIMDDATLDDMDVQDVFARCLDTHAVLPEERDELVQAYHEILASLHEEDQNAE